MVFQANKPIKIYGTCKKGAEITVTFPHQTVKIKSKSETYVIEVSPMPVTKQGFSWTISSKKQIETIYNCLVGEVFLISGEGNIEFALKDSYIPYIREVPFIRFYEIPHLHYPEAAEEFPTRFQDEVRWTVANQFSSSQFSALGYFIAIGLFENLQNPIGIISMSEYDASIFSYLDKKELLSNAKLRRIMLQYQKELDKYEQNFQYNSLYEQELSYVRDVKHARNLPMGPKHFNRPSGMLERLHNSLNGYPIKGVYFYQGESDIDQADIYKDALWKLFDTLRLEFDDSRLPIVFTQLANYNYPGIPSKKVAELRDAQRKCMDINDLIYMVSAIDLGDAEEKIYKDKFPVAERVVNIILERIYKMGKNNTSPAYYSHYKSQSQVIIMTQFNTLPLVSKSMHNLGFYASEDGVNFKECRDVEAHGNQIVISGVRLAKVIEYGYVSNPLMDIYSSNGLPLLPFRIELEN